MNWASRSVERRQRRQRAARGALGACAHALARMYGFAHLRMRKATKGGKERPKVLWIRGATSDTTPSSTTAPRHAARAARCSVLGAVGADGADESNRCYGIVLHMNPITPLRQSGRWRGSEIPRDTKAGEIESSTLVAHPWPPARCRRLPRLTPSRVR